jgi:hypothetical protein
MRSGRFRIVNPIFRRRRNVFLIPMSPQPMISSMRHWEMGVSHRNPACRGSFRACFHRETVRSDENRLVSIGNGLTCIGNRLIGVGNGLIDIANDEFSMANRRFLTGNKTARTAAGR